MENKLGIKTDPWGTPHGKVADAKISLPKETDMVLSRPLQGGL